MNLFVLNTLLPQVPTRVIFRECCRSWRLTACAFAILIAFPILSLWLPRLHE